MGTTPVGVYRDPGSQSRPVCIELHSVDLFCSTDRCELRVQAAVPMEMIASGSDGKHG